MGLKISMPDMVRTLEWHTLQERRLVRRLTILFQIQHGGIAVHTPEYITHFSRSRPHPLQYSPIPANKLSYIDSFWPRTILSWNVLPLNIVSSSSADQFKNNIWAAFDAGNIQMASNRDPLARIRPHGQGPLILF